MYTILMSQKIITAHPYQLYTDHLYHEITQLITWPEINAYNNNIIHTFYLKFKLEQVFKLITKQVNQRPSCIAQRNLFSTDMHPLKILFDIT